MWEKPKVDWQNNNIPTAKDFDRIENNIKYIQILLG